MPVIERRLVTAGGQVANPQQSPTFSRHPETGPRFGVLGPLEVSVGADELPLGSPKQRLVLAMLLCEPGVAVPVVRLLDALWPGEKPRHARKTVQVYVSSLRKVLEDAGEGARISFDQSGYSIAVRPEEIDSLRFEQLAREGDRHLLNGDIETGTATLKEALSLWRGPVLPELQHVDALRQIATRLAGRRVTVFERWVEAELAHRGPLAVLDPLAEIALEHPLRERLRALQMTALRSVGRSVEALAVHDEVRQGLAREFGLDPGPAIRQAYRELLENGFVRVAPVGRSGPPERSRSRVPRAPEDFTGRRTEAEQVAACLTEPGYAHTVVLHGQVGAGKTALALHVANRLHVEFPDGCVLLRLRGEDGTPRALASALAELWQISGLPGTPPPDDEAAAAIWQDRLATRRLLLILDDARDESVVRRLAPQEGASAALITSRSRLSALGHVVRTELPVFGVDQAVELLERVIGAPRVARDPKAAEHIVRSAGLLPLGVRVAADRLDALRHVLLADFAARLDRPAKRLDQLRVGDISVRDRLDAALADLPDGSRAQLLGLSSLPLQPFTLREAEEATGIASDALCELLETLVENGVVTAPARAASRSLTCFALPHLMHLRLRELAVAP